MTNEFDKDKLAADQGYTAINNVADGTEMDSSWSD